MKTILLILASIVLCGNLSANEPPRQVSGCITDEKGETLPYANILVKGTTHGTASDLDGNYKLDLSKPGEYHLIIKVLLLLSSASIYTAIRSLTFA